MSRASDLETRFQWAADALLQPASPRWKLSALNVFLADTPDDPAAAEAFLLEYSDQVHGLIMELDVGGLSGAFLEETAGLISEAMSRSPVLQGEPLLVRARDLLRRVAAGRYACINDLERAWQVLEHTEGPPPWWAGVAKIPGIDVHQRIDRLVEAAHRAGHPVAEDLDSLAFVARSARNDGPHAACTAVVETGLNSDATDPGIGGVRLLRVEILAERADEDDVRPDVLPSDPYPNGRQIFDTALAAGRRLLEHVNPSARGRYLVGRIRFESPGLPHTGQSADLAVAALFFSAAQAFVDGRRRYEIAPLVVFTGSVDRDGTVLPIAGDTLDLKVEAAFHSWDRTMVVPFDQVMEARSVADRLNDEHPGRNLEIVGVRTMFDLVHDRRVMREVVTPPVIHAARWAWNRRWSVGGVISILAFGGLVLSLLIGPIDRNPVSVVPTAEGMALLNGRGRTLASLVSTTRSGFPNHDDAQVNRVALGDTDGDGLNEMCWSEEADGVLVEAPRVLCREVSDAAPYFEMSLMFDEVFPDDPQIAVHRFQGNHVHLVDIDLDGRAELVLGLNHAALYPSLILVVDPRTGSERGRYVHTGSISDVAFHDFEADGLPEILAAGINNAFDRSVLFVLDPRNLSGSSPTSPNRMPAEYKPGTELAYLRFRPGPLSHVPSVEGIRGAGGVGVWPTDRLVVVSVNEALKRPSGGGPLRQAQLVYQFSLDLEPLACVSNTDYDRIERELIADGFLEAEFSSEQRKELLESIEYWDGETWRDSVFTRLKSRD